MKDNLDTSDDARLSARLKEWRGVEPRPDFEAMVWQRVAATTAETAPVQGWFAAWREWLDVQPAWVAAAALLMGILTGAGTALSLAQAPVAQSTISAPALHGPTLADAYLSMISGGNQ